MSVFRIIFAQLLILYAISTRRTEERKKKKGLWSRLYKTIRRICKETWYIFLLLLLFIKFSLYFIILIYFN